MMATICDKKKWKNKRNRSLYNKEADDGFIFRVPGVASTNDNAKQETEESLDVEDVRRQVEVDRFLAELRRDVVEAGSSLTEEQQDGFQQLAKDLTENNLYLHFLEEQDVRTDAPDEATEESHVPQLKATLNHNIEKCQRELGKWKAVIEERQRLTEQAKEGYSKEKHLDFLTLPNKHTEPLKSFLPPDLLPLIEPEGPSVFISSTAQQLDLLESQLDKELDRLSSLCERSRPYIQQLDQSMIKSTPMTLFRAVKESDPNQTIS